MSILMTGHSNGVVDAIFNFYAVPENPLVPDGSSMKKGIYQHGRVLTLNEGEWIKQPLFYGLVEFEGIVDPDLMTYSGTIDSPDCTTFEATRQ